MNDEILKPPLGSQPQTDLMSQADKTSLAETSLPEPLDDFKKNIQKFLPFLEDLRSRLYRGVILFVAVFAVGFLSARLIVKKTLDFVDIDKVTIATSSPFQFVEVSMNIGYFLAITVSVPYILYSFYIFITPALRRREKIHLIKSIPLSFALFIAGFSYGLSILYYALGILAAINVSLGVSNFWNISQFLSEMLFTSALLGLIFEFPLVLTLLIKMGITTPQILKNNRKVAFFVSILVTALLPPTDIISLIAMTLPLVLLYEGTILFNRKNRVWINN